MKNRMGLILYITIFSFVFACETINKTAEDNNLESGFITPPDSIQTSVYWYWISDNVSKEGVVKDLHAMKKAGINRAFIGNIGVEGVPYGKVKMFSDEWWEVLHAALKTATELDIGIGIFNSPGWSQSGGPWIEAGEAMRYLASSELKVRGPRKLLQKLEQPAGLFQDVKVIACPSPEGAGLVLDARNGQISSVPAVPGLIKTADEDDKTAVLFPPKEDFSLVLRAESPFTARSLYIRPAATKIVADVLFQTMEKDGAFRTIREFRINRPNISLNVGFEPYAPLVVSFPATTASTFRLVFKNANTGSGISELSLLSSPRVEWYSEKTLSKMHPTPLPYWHDYQWPQPPENDDPALVIDGSKVIDLSEFMADDGTLTWEVPEGEWTILRTGMTPTGVTNSPASPESTGLEVDKMSKKHVEKHFSSFMGEILKRIPEADRRCFQVVVQDSYETGGQNFTDDFIEEFEKKYGYNPVPYLPVYRGMVVNSPLESDRFLWDMRRMVADKVAYDYVGGLREISHKHGLRTWLENYGHWGFPGEFLMYGGQSDEIAGEFWSEGDLGNIENRAATSCGHIYGKTKISSESNTYGGRAFSRYPAMFKQRGDRFFAEGINNTLLHVFISQPYEDKNPGVNAWFGNEFNRKNTWFSQMDVYSQYLKRANFMLQQGLNIADAAYFIGEDAPKMTGITDPPLPVGYQFDYINAEVIEKYMTVKEGLLTLPHGTQYRILVLPPLETMRPGLLEKISQLVNDGAVVLGPAPRRSPSQQDQPGADQKVQELASLLWGDVDGMKVKSGKCGKGTILMGLSMEEAFRIIGCVPDCKLPADNSIHYGHRKSEKWDIYFISNQTGETKQVTPEFRVAGKQPELWEATTGTMRFLPSYEKKGNVTAVPLKLEPYESAFILFRFSTRRSSQDGITTNYPEPTLIAEMNDPWNVQFDASMGGPAAPVVFDTLRDWSTFENEQIRYYSGTAFYSSHFVSGELPRDKQILINLGQLSAMAKVYVNAAYAGGVWTPPHQLDITEWVKQGKNEIVIEVVNTWENRLIGDSYLPENQRQTWCPVNPYRPDMPLHPSGLLGPVKILAIRY